MITIFIITQAIDTHGVMGRIIHIATITGTGLLIVTIIRIIIILIVKHTKATTVLA